MLVNYKEYGFSIAARTLPEACVACPFWGFDIRDVENGTCTITGTRIKVDGKQDKERMPDCPVVEGKARKRRRRRQKGLHR